MCEHDYLEEIGATSRRFGPRARFLANIRPQARLFILGAALTLNLAWSSSISSLLLMASCLALLLALGLPPRTLASRLAIPWYFASVAVATQLLFTGSIPILQVGSVVAYAEGLERGLLLGSKIVAGTTLVLTFSLTSTVTELLSLAAWLRLPPILVEISALTYRYLFLLAEDGQRIREAQAARLGHSTWWRSVRSYGMLIGMVIARSYDRAEGVYQAMAARGYSGTLQIEACGKVGLADLRAVAIGMATLLAISLLGTVYGS
ncbi:MAG: cobalt ECF transporter T component CbiQ [Chloroflexi bacterium]|nr:cobalt ECF transporter T component CbiQ [Chloroflexota bacterium]